MKTKNANRIIVKEKNFVQFTRIEEPIRYITQFVPANQLINNQSINNNSANQSVNQSRHSYAVQYWLIRFHSEILHFISERVHNKFKIYKNLYT